MKKKVHKAFPGKKKAPGRITASNKSGSKSGQLSKQHTNLSLYKTKRDAT